MRLLTIASFLFPALSLAAPLETRQEPCAPTSYTITNYRYTSGPSGARVLFNFQSHFSDPSIIEDPSSAGATCDANAPSGTIPNQNSCSSGNLSFDLRAPQQNAEYQILHQWRCNGRSWISSTPQKMVPLSCTTDQAGVTSCTSPAVSFAPQNVRQICGAPTCP